LIARRDQNELPKYYKISSEESKQDIPLLPQIVAQITRHVRFPGRERILRILFPPEYFRFKYEEKVVYYDKGLRLRCDLGSYIEWSIFFKGYYAPDLSLALKHFVKPGMFVIDVGANIGAYTLIFGKQVGPRGKVISVEPNPETYDRLLYNIEFNGLEDTVKVFKIALSDKPGEGTLFVPEKNHPHRGIASLQKYSDSLTTDFKVKIETLDGLANKLNLPRIDFLKVDTDGSDAFVLEGARTTLQHFHPMIVFEANYLAHQDSEATILKARDMLLSLDYEFYTVGLFGRLLRIEESQKLPDTNIVCLPGVGK
jgi:FkbM family methyltransferase